MTPHDTHRGGGILAAGAPAKPATAPPPGSGWSVLGGAQSDGTPSSERPQLAVGRHYVCEVEGGRDLALVWFLGATRGFEPARFEVDRPETWPSEGEAL